MVDLFSGFLDGSDTFGELPEKPLLHIGANIGKRNISVAAEIAYFPRSRSPYARHEDVKLLGHGLLCQRQPAAQCKKLFLKSALPAKQYMNPLGYLILYQGGTDRGEARWNEREAEGDMSDGRYLVRVRKYHIANETMIII